MVAGKVRVPSCPRTAHTIARNWYESLIRSGQSKYFEPSDWRAALLLVEALTRLLSPIPVVTKEGAVVYVKMPVSGKDLSAIWSAMNDVMTTEGARRRARLEIERMPEDEKAPENVTDIDAYLNAGSN